MAGLVPAIHAVAADGTLNHLYGGPAWVAGTSPAMTARGVRQIAIQFRGWLL